MSDTRYKDADWLEEQYHEKELSTYEIADKCDVSRRTVRYWMKNHDIERRHQYDNGDTRYQDAEWLQEQYHDNELSQREIADKCGVSSTTVERWMKNHDIEARDMLEVIRRTGVGIRSLHGYEVWEECSNGQSQVQVHRLLAVAKYGFDAVCDMDVHHQNGIRWDNRPDNIKLLTRSEHRTHHARDQHDNIDMRYRDAEWLQEQYHDNELSQQEIADKCDVSRSTVQRWMENNDIERREPAHNLRSDKPTGQLTLDDTRNLEGAQTVNQ